MVTNTISVDNHSRSIRKIPLVEVRLLIKAKLVGAQVQSSRRVDFVNEKTISLTFEPIHHAEHLHVLPSLVRVGGHAQQIYAGCLISHHCRVCEPRLVHFGVSFQNTALVRVDSFKGLASR